MNEDTTTAVLRRRVADAEASLRQAQDALRTHLQPARPPWPSGNGEMARRIRAHDWAATPLGPIEQWPLSLRTALTIVLDHPFPMILAWGTDLISLYNDAYRPLLGAKAEALGRPFLDVWSEARDTIEPQIARAQAGEASRFDDAHFPLLNREMFAEAFFDYSFTPIRDETGAVVGILNMAIEKTEHVHAGRRRALADQMLRASEERQAFLLKLSDTLRPIADPGELADTACRLLADYLGGSQAQYVDLRGEPGEEMGEVRGEHVGSGTTFPRRFPLAPFGEPILQTLRAGTSLVVRDVDTDPRLDRQQRDAFLAVKAPAVISVPLVKHDRWIAALTVHNPTPRQWSRQDVRVVEEVGERTWSAIERARAEAALRESETRFAQFAEASSDAVWIRDAETFAFEYASPAVRTVFGIAPEALLADERNLNVLLVPEDRDAASAKVSRVSAGERIVQEYRIQRPTDRAFRWIESTGFPLHDAQGRVTRIAAIASDVTEAKLLADHQAVLLAELQHRVRNIMAVIQSIIARTGENARSIEEYTERMNGRLMSFANVQALLTRGANVGVGIATIVRTELAAYADDDQYTMTGPDVVLSPKAAEVLTLAVHELTTNAMKYGALSDCNGDVEVTWSISPRQGTDWLSFDWRERRTPPKRQPPPDTLGRRGFGRELIEGRVPYELGGNGRIEIMPEGAHCHLDFPLVEGASILETDAPHPVTVFGGAIDTAGDADLEGHVIVVLEDDYYLASDTTRALRDAGAAVMGPYASARAARAAIADPRLTGAVLDINLAGTRTFDLARDLAARGVPFLFITGYDADVIPAEFERITRLQKPVDYMKLVGTFAAAVRYRT